MKNLFFGAAILLIAGFIGLHIYSAEDPLNETSNVQATKYKDISFEIDSQWNNEYQLYETIPVTENKDINKQVKKEIGSIKDNFLEDTSSRKPEDGGVWDLNVSSDVDFASDDYVNFISIVTRNNNFEGEEFEITSLFDRNSGEKITIDQFFIEGSNYLDRLSELSKQALQDQLGDKYSTTKVESGTAPDIKNFNNFGIASEDSFHFDFEPGQVADESEGIIRVEIKLDDVEDILNKDLEKKIFGAHVAEIERQKKLEEEKKKAAEEAAKKAAEQQAQSEADTSGVVQTQTSADCQNNKCVALTFDDGPGSSTPQLLDILSQHGAKATFFMIGQQVEPNAGIVKRVNNDGHEIGNHTWNHQDLTKLSDSEIRSQIDQTNTAIAHAAGITPVLVRPPYGAVNDHVVEIVNRPIILWSVDPEDWKDRNADTVYQRVIDKTVAGSVVLSHDIHPTTVQAYERLVPKLIEDGFTLVTASQLLGIDLNNPVAKTYY